jgi:hypothetical protein
MDSTDSNTSSDTPVTQQAGTGVTNQQEQSQAATSASSTNKDTNPSSSRDDSDMSVRDRDATQQVPDKRPRSRSPLMSSKHDRDGDVVNADDRERDRRDKHVREEGDRYVDDDRKRSRSRSYRDDDGAPYPRSRSPYSRSHSSRSRHNSRHRYDDDKYVTMINTGDTARHHVSDTIETMTATGIEIE